MNLLFFVFGISIFTSTTDISSVVEIIAPDDVKVNNLVPGGMCPGHFDISPLEANNLFLSDIIIYHGFECWLKRIKGLKSDVEIVDLQTDGNWMIPDVYKKGAFEIYNILKREYGSDSIRTREIDKNYEKFKMSVDSISNIVRKKKESIQGIKVVCNEHQKDFLLFLGAEVSAVFSPGDEISLKEIAGVIKVGREKNVQLVVDNLQSGHKVGRTIADELECKYVVLSNFPEEKGYKSTLLNNIDLLLDILIDKDKRS